MRIAKTRIARKRCLVMGYKVILGVNHHRAVTLNWGFGVND